MKKVHSFRIDEQLFAELEKRAHAENRTVSNLIETAIKDYLKKRSSNKP